MKNQVLIAVALISFIPAPAQPKTEQELRLKAHRTLVNSLLKHQDYNGGNVAKPTDIQYRVKSQVLTSNFSLKDSAVFKYSGTRNSKFNYDSEAFAYPTVIEPYYSVLSMIPFIDKPSEVLADSIISYRDDVLDHKLTATYRPDNKVILSSIAQFPAGTAPEYGTFSRYNSGGNLVAIYNIYDNDTADKRNITYNSAFTQVVTDTLFEKNGNNYELAAVSRFFYNNQNKIDSILLSEPNGPGQMVVTDRITFGYYADGKVQKIRYYYLGDDSDGFHNIDSFGYTTGIAYTTLRDTRSTFVIQQDTLNYWERTLKYPGANGLPDSTKNFSFDEESSGWEEYQNAVYTYTHFDAPETITFYQNGDTLGGNRFYYEAYDDSPSAIKPITENKTFYIYPNPFNNKIAIDWKSDLSAAQVKVSLINIAGQEVYHTALKLHSGQNELSLPAVNDGSYLLIIQTADGKTWSNKMIKQ